MKKPAYRIEASPLDGREYIECGRCGSRSYSYQDIRARYCPWCHVHHPAVLAPDIPEGVGSRDADS